MKNDRTGIKMMAPLEKPPAPSYKNEKNQNVQEKNKMQRRCSWKLGSRPSLKRKKKRSGSESDTMPLNNGRDHSQCNGGGVARHVSNIRDMYVTSRLVNNKAC